MRKIKRYVPAKALEFIKSSNYKNPDHLYIICDMINRITIYRKEDDNSSKYRDIPKEYFRNIISDYSYLKSAFEFLENNNIVTCDGIYSKEAGKALGYKFENQFISKLEAVELESFTISKNIINNVNKNNNATKRELKSYKEYFLKTFKIDFEGASKWLDNWFEEEKEKIEYSNSYTEEVIKLLNKYNRLFISINAINDGELFFRKNDTNGRIDTNLTSLKKEFKQFIKIDNLFQVDIVNSQPFFLCTILNSLLCRRKSSETVMDKEIQKFVNWCIEGKLYENFSQEYFRQTSKLLKRSEIKEMMFCIFYSKNNSYRKEKSIFKQLFPTILEWIEKQKEKNHNQFSIRLQKIESEICIDEILPILEEANIKYFTIHDSWLVQKQDLDKTIKIVEAKFLEKFGIKPKLNIENLKNIKKEELPIFEKPKTKILYKGYQEVEINEITSEDKKLFLEAINRLNDNYYGASENLLLDLNLFDKYTTWYLYDKWINSKKNNINYENQQSN